MTASGPQEAAATGGAGPGPAAAVRTRLAAIDQVRGLVIVLMVLDHVRDFFGSASVSPTDLDHTTPALFLTRWITHFCAPTFVFLAGAGAYLAGAGRPRRELRRFLLQRGLWLVALELTVVGFVWSFRFPSPIGFVLQVIWAIGASMVVLSALVGLPTWAVGAIGVAMIATHNLLDGIDPASFGGLAPLWILLHVQAPIPVGFVAYPLVPWVGVMAAGYAAGTLYALPSRERLRLLVGFGLAACAGFVLLRAAGGYGDPSPWSRHRGPALTALSFLNVTKYPPSLAYLLMTLGPMALLLAAFERWPSLERRSLATFGRVPLFAYVVHLAIAHLAAGLLGIGLGFGTAILVGLPFGYPKDWGLPLPGVYAAWAGVLLALYPACAWFAGVKRRRTEWWLRYL